MVQKSFFYFSKYLKHKLTGEKCSDTRQFSLTNTKANCEEGLSCLPSEDKFTCQVETSHNSYEVESFRNLFDKDTVPMKYADSEVIWCFY